MVPGIRKLRYLVATESELIIRVCIALTLLSVIGAGVTYANPPTTDVTNVIDRQTAVTNVHTQATVEGESLLYERGETLSDMPVYSRSATPNVTVRAVTTVPSGEEVQITQKITLVYEARTADNEVFWRQTRPLETIDDVVTDGTVVNNASINIPAIDRRLSRLETEIGDAGRVNVYLKVQTAYETARHDGTLEDRGTILIREKSYEIEEFSMKNEHGITETQKRPIPSKVVSVSLPLLPAIILPHTTIAFALLALGGLIALGVCVTAADQFNPEVERTELHKVRYADWISEGTLPAHLADRVVLMDTLEGLVDIAIDTEKRVIYDSSEGYYAVMDDNTAYVYVENNAESFEWGVSNDKNLGE